MSSLPLPCPLASALPRMRPGAVLLALYLLVYVSWQATHWIPLQRELAGDLLAVTITSAAVWAAWRAARRTRESPRLSSAWRWIALALAGQAAGSVAQLIYEYAFGSLAYPTIADPLYLSFYPLLLVGVLRLPAVPRSRREAFELTVDCATVALGAGALVVFLVLGPDAVAAGTRLQIAASVAYPVGDLILLVALGAALLRTPAPDTYASLRWMTAAIGLFVAADLVYGYISLHGAYHGGDPIDTLYVLAFACFAIAAVRQRPPAGTHVQPRPAPAAARVHWLPYAAIGLCLATVLASEADQPVFPDVTLTLVVALVTLLVIARQVASLHSLGHSRTRLAEAQQLAHIGWWEWDVEGDRIFASEEEARIYGLMPSDFPISLDTALQAIHPEDRERVGELVRTALTDHQPFAYELRILRPDGEVRSLLAQGDVQLRGGRVVRMHGTHQDFTERRQLERALDYQADHDPLTGLPNRRRFAEELDNVLRYATRYGRHGALLIVDVDNLNYVNDVHGHASGDAALKAIAQVIVAGASETDLLGRIGGDEFAIVVPEADEQHARGAAELIRRAIAEGNGRDPIRASIGIALFDADTELVADDLLIGADIALHEAKEAGRDQVRVYGGRAGKALSWIESIRAALSDGRLVLYAQPILDLQTDRVVRHELLLRMIGEDGEAIPPDAFLPIAERFGLINEIDRWVVGQGLALAAGGEPVSINLSAASIGDERILTAVRAAIADGLDPTAAIFEITETAVMTNMGEAQTFAGELTRLGCHVALDDFGTGFGSFSYLKHLPARYIKIDMEFVRELVWNTTDQQVVKAINSVAHSLGKSTIAEGVEDAATLAALRAFGVDCAQGFYVGRPRVLEAAPGASHAVLS